MTYPKFDKPDFGETREAFNAVDMVSADSEFIIAVVDSIVLLIAQIDDAVIGAKTVGMDG